MVSSSQPAPGDDDGGKQRRILMFILLCVPIRGFLAWCAWKLGREESDEDKWKKYPLAVFTTVAGIGMITTGFLRSSGKREDKGFAGGEVYWNSYLHGSLYLLFTLLFLMDFKHAYAVLIVDVVIGLGSAVNHYLL
mgnify:CR=1 FL=1